jgi:hypothetical protein
MDNDLLSKTDVMLVISDYIFSLEKKLKESPGSTEIRYKISAAREIQSRMTLFTSKGIRVIDGGLR